MAKRPVQKEILNTEELFNMAVVAAKQGQRSGARVMFRQILEQDKRNIRAMMYLAKLAGADKERTAWLNRILEIRPGYEPAEEMVARLARNKQVTRNRRLFHLAIGTYAVLLIAIAAFLMIQAASWTVL